MHAEMESQHFCQTCCMKGVECVCNGVEYVCAGVGSVCAGVESVCNGVEPVCNLCILYKKQYYFNLCGISLVFLLYF